MGNITRDQLVSKHEEIVNKLDELKSKKYEYKTATGCDGFGPVKGMTIQELLRASVNVHECSANLEARIQQYGVTEADLEGKCPLEYQGCPIDDWDHDFALRVQQIHDQQMISKCEKALELMEKNFSEDDRFKMDMAAVENFGITL